MLWQQIAGGKEIPDGDFMITVPLLVYSLIRVIWSLKKRDGYSVRCLCIFDPYM